MSQRDVQEQILTTISELLTDICDETNGEDRNDSMSHLISRKDSSAVFKQKNSKCENTEISHAIIEIYKN